jgi:hypothetical protein
MTENEWLTSADPGSMLQFVRGKTTDRKLWLFVCACYRHFFSPDFTKEFVQVEQQMKAARRAMEAAENYADGALGVEALRQFVRPDALPAILEPSNFYHLVVDTDANALSAAQTAGEWGQLVCGHAEDAMWIQVWILRDLVGNPFRPIHSIPAWRTWNDGAICKIAQAIFEGRYFDRLPILADALEDAGCDNADILAHCRGPNEHVRGCWVVDLILGKN